MPQMQIQGIGGGQGQTQTQTQQYPQPASASSSSSSLAAAAAAYAASYIQGAGSYIPQQSPDSLGGLGAGLGRAGSAEQRAHTSPRMHDQQQQQGSSPRHTHLALPQTVVLSHGPRVPGSQQVISGQQAGRQYSYPEYYTPPTMAAPSGSAWAGYPAAQGQHQPRPPSQPRHPQHATQGHPHAYQHYSSGAEYGQYEGADSDAHDGGADHGSQEERNAGAGDGDGG
ncbi:hypothetical protein B0H11DRAFT_1956827 [Mycena galericulata]|nr:hypothetical protein B0H11DRAFT_1956827 [Mycena galericulata]